MKRLKRGVLDDFEVENCDSVNMIYRCVMILKFVDVLLLNRRHKSFFTHFLSTKVFYDILLYTTLLV